MENHEQKIQTLALNYALDWYYSTSGASVADTVEKGIEIYKELRDEPYRD